MDYTTSNNKEVDMLTKGQLAERRKGIGASDAAKIIAGDWHQLWLEKTGRAEGEDLTWVFPVQLGSVTEALNLLFYGHNTGHEVTRCGEAVISKDHPFLRCTLDGFDAAEGAVVECKHVNGFSKIEAVKERYTPQVIHQMICTGVRKGVLSVIIGTSEPVLEAIEYDDFFANEYISKAKEFWGFVERDEEPTLGKAMEVAPIAPEKMRTVDMTGSNEWAAGAADWLANKDAAKKFEGAQKALKDMVEADVCKASGHGLTITRSKAGSLLFKGDK
jgi:predicted phage-related endonuclease